MGKYKTGLVREVKEENKFNENQEKLKAKHDIPIDKDIVIVEKQNAIKFIINLAIRLIKFLFLIALLFLGTVGLTALIEPETRALLVNIFLDLVEQIIQFLSW